MVSSNNGAKPDLLTKNDFSLLQWAALLGVIVFLFVFPFKAGLFNGFDFTFEANLFEGAIFASVLLLMIGILMFWHWRPTDVKSWMAVAVLALPLCYFISAQRAVSEYNADLMVLLMFVTAGFYIMGLYLAKDKLGSTVLEHSIQFAAYMVVIYGVLNLFGQVYYPEAMWLAHNGYRLTSVFQYSNAYAAFLTAALLGSLYFIIRTNRWYWLGMHAIMLVPILLSFALTYSRGGIVLLPVVLLLILPFLTIARQVLLLGHMAISGVLTLLILGNISQNTEQIAQAVQPSDLKPATVISAWSGLPLQSWMLLLGASVVAAGLCILLQHKISGWITAKTEGMQSRKGSSLFLPAGIIGLGIVLFGLLLATNGFRGILPDSISERLASINFQQHSVLERKTFYQDALKMSSDYPVLGAGGGAWSVLYEQYQNNPYLSRQAHSFLFQTLVEVGWLGLFVVLLILALTFYLFTRMQKNHENKEHQLYFYIVAVSLLTHSLIDFDMSYVYIAALVFLSLGSMIAPYEHNIQLTWLAKKQSITRYVYPAIISIAAITAIFMAHRQYEANQNFQQVTYMVNQQQANLEEVLPYLNKVHELSPKHPTYNLTRAELMTHVYKSTGDTNYLMESKKFLDQAQLYEPNNRLILLAEYRYLKDSGQIDRVPAFLETTLTKFQWDIMFYDLAIMEYFTIGKMERDQNLQASEAKWNRALEIYDEILKRRDQLKNLPEEQQQGRDFNISPMTAQAIGQIYYYRGDYTTAINILELHSNSDPSEEYVKVNLRYYLASLKAMGQWNEELYQRLLAVDPNEEAIINELQP
ncbi:O-antigen ligase family protein [Paenibacillus tarimensis]|uniref:O-antigen ligase family protein n=1 Tax=Paenibacillus tarimensis TaxID=416012 RepID=UPI001F22092A|nr:O-antigen ligase family protein [Paenibacillus tarimensis]MCF2945895.1 O-antigen ligase family protein [Paenibacillus tarimensis]